MLVLFFDMYTINKKIITCTTEGNSLQRINLLLNWGGSFNTNGITIKIRSFLHILSSIIFGLENVLDYSFAFITYYVVPSSLFFLLLFLSLVSSTTLKKLSYNTRSLPLLSSLSFSFFFFLFSTFRLVLMLLLVELVFLFFVSSTCKQ